MAGIFLALVPLKPVLAQSAADISNAARQSENIQRQQLQRQQDDIRRSLRNRRPPARIEAPLPAVPQGDGRQCHDISAIRLTGADKLRNTKAVRKLLRPYLNKCLGVTEIQALMAEMTRYYIEHGFATTRVYLPQQDLSKGSLTLEVTEGKLTGLHEPFDRKSTVFIPGAFPGMIGEVLNLRDIEQGLDQLNRLESNHATMDILPGKGVGESQIIIKNEQTKPWHVNLTGDNYGPRTTGREQLGATVSLDDLVGLNEFYSYTRRASVPFNDREKQSMSDSLLFSIPYGYTTLTSGFTQSDYNSTLSTPAGTTLPLSGDNKALFLTLDQGVWRNQDSKVNVNGTLTRKTSNNFIAGQKLDVSSRTLTVLDLGVNYSTQAFGGFVSLGSIYSKGLHFLGAEDDAPALPKFAPRAQFTKLAITSSYIRPFEVMGQSLTYSNQISGQVSKDVLFGTEQFSLGGIYTVRGFYDESLANDKGILTRNDLSLNKTIGFIRGRPVAFTPYIALDGGVIGGRAQGSLSGALVGAAVGFRLAAGPASFDIFTGHPIASPHYLDDEGFNTFGRFSVSF